MKQKLRIMSLSLALIIPISFIGCSETLDKLTTIGNVNFKTDDKNKDELNNQDNKLDDIDKVTDIEDSNITVDKVTDDKTENLEKVMREYNVFYYDIDYNIYSFKRNVEVIDKGVVKALTRELKVSPNDKVLATLPEGVEIRSAKVENRILTVDFGSDFYEKINLGSGSEAAMINCIVNTFGYNLGVDEVILKVGGKNYESGHILLEVGSTFKVDLSKVKEEV